MNLQGKTVCFLGDSITEGCGASATEKCYVSLFAAAHPDTRVHNYGIGGTRIADQKVPTELKYEFPFYTRVEQMEYNADLICVFGGTNDFGHGDAPMGKLGNKTPDTFYGALYTLSEKLLQRYPDAKIVFFTPLHCAWETTPTKRLSPIRLSACAIKLCICAPLPKRRALMLKHLPARLCGL